MSAGEERAAGGDRGSRTGGSGFRAWLLLDADRPVVAASVAALLLLALVVPEAIAPGLLAGALEAGDPVETLFQALIAGIVTGVTLVVTITQLVLSQELGAAGDQRERMRRALAFQEDLEETLDADVSPPEPASFLDWLVRATRERARALREAASGEPEDYRERVDRLVEAVEGDSSVVTDRLEDAEFGTFQVIRAALDYDYSWKIHLCRRLRVEHGDGLGEESGRALDGLLEALRFFGPAREHFKTLYFQWELTNLSRRIVYAAVPALLCAIGTTLYAGRWPATGTVLFGLEARIWLVCASAVVALVPFLLLLSHMLRIVTVTQRTLAIGPFVLRRTDRDRVPARAAEASG